MQVIIYPIDGGIAVIHPTLAFLADQSIEALAQKDVPAGVPYLIIDADQLPTDRTFRGAWEADFTTPDGYGAGA